MRYCHLRGNSSPFCKRKLDIIPKQLGLHMRESYDLYYSICSLFVVTVQCKFELSRDKKKRERKERVCDMHGSGRVLQVAALGFFLLGDDN
jgi:hypothetical protein